MTLEAWALFCLTETLLCLNPGPSTLLVLSVALTRGQVAGLFASIGVLAANAVYFTLSASGLVAVHARFGAGLPRDQAGPEPPT